MIPLKAESPVFSPPIVTWTLIALNVAGFLWMKSGGGSGFERAIYQYAAIPENVMGGDVTVLVYESEPVAAIVSGSIVGYSDDFRPELLRLVRTWEGARYFYGTRFEAVPLDAIRQKIPPWLTILTSMFMHAGWLHLIGNMWALNVFGMSLEDSLGKLPYLGFYLACGLAAAGAHVAHDPNSIVATLGASGAIAGVMGGFAVRIPWAQVLTLVPIILYTIVHIPAWIFMLIYIGEQIFMSVADVRGSGGVAWFAHIGGFAAGYFLIRVLPVTRRWRPILNHHAPSPFA